ncbi:MAG: hypothetical protein ABIN25_02595 [Ginsengibacter sp.]
MLLKEITLQTISIKALFNFYRNILELPVTFIDEKKICVTAGASELIFEEAGNGKDPFYHFAFNIPANKMNEAVEWLKNKVELIWLEEYKSFVADFRNWKAKSVYFYDDAGNILELIARVDVGNEQSEPFSSEQFLNVSEIGLVIKGENFNSLANEILDKYKLCYFPKQPPLPHFRAIGDDEGLFIMVPEKRNWYATDKASGIFSIKILFINGGELRELKM